MTSTQIDINNVKASLSQRMIDKFECVCQAYIKELLILKKDEEEKGNVEQYSWLNIVDQQGRSHSIAGIIERMFFKNNYTLLLSVISDYMDPEEDVYIRRFLCNYAIYMYKYTVTGDQIITRCLTNIPDEFNPTTMIFKYGMHHYMKINIPFVKHHLFNVVDNNKDLIQLK